MSALANLAVHMQSRAQAGGWADDTALVVGDGCFTHSQVHEGAARVATLLAERGAAPGHTVLIALPDGVELMWTFLAALRLGAVAVLVNPRLTAEDHRFALADCAASVAVGSDELEERFSGARWLSVGELDAGLWGYPPAAAVPVDPASRAYAQYTSGTTGRPKAAVRRHRDPLTYFEAFALGAAGMRRQDKVLSVSKMSFAYGLGNSLFFPLLSGATAVLVPGAVLAADVAHLLEQHSVTMLFAVPTFYARLLSVAPPSCFRSLRLAVSAGEPLMVALARRSAELLGCPLLDGLGTTEVGQTLVSNTLTVRREGSVGRPLGPYRVALRDDEGVDLPVGKTGHLWVSGPTVLVEYLGRPEASAAAKEAEWLRTGDRARLDEEGFVYLEGRTDDLEMVAGISVAPCEIEEALSSHPLVAEVAVVSVRDAEGASRLEAFVVPTSHPGAGEDGLAAELVRLARDRLAPHKVPRAVHLVAALPRTPTGKLKRFLLRGGGVGAASGTDEGGRL